MTIPGTDWHPWLYLREVAQLGLVTLSLVLGNHHLRHMNRFNYAAILEVAALFFSIFITMQPALQILAIEGPNLGLTEPWQYFWATGGLSSVLDNAPTYVVFFETARALTEQAGLVRPPQAWPTAVCIGDIPVFASGQGSQGSGIRGQDSAGHSRSDAALQSLAPGP